jgi:peptide-methionine (R)-S-oxide reductase
MRSRWLIALPLVSMSGAPVVAQNNGAKTDEKAKKTPIVKVVKTDAEWRKILNPMAFRVMRQKDTEQAYSGKYWHTKTEGTYRCVACDLELFSSKHKFDSGTGWPSFWLPIDKEHIETSTDHDLGYERIEVHCARCGGHLGHVFDDGPRPTGLRYCMNSVSLKFVKSEPPPRK